MIPPLPAPRCVQGKQPPPPSLLPLANPLWRLCSCAAQHQCRQPGRGRGTCIMTAAACWRAYDRRCSQPRREAWRRVMSSVTRRLRAVCAPHTAASVHVGSSHRPFSILKPHDTPKLKSLHKWKDLSCCFVLPSTEKAKERCGQHCKKIWSESTHVLSAAEHRSV